MMAEDWQVLRSTLETTQQELKKANTRVAELEARLPYADASLAAPYEDGAWYRRTLDTMLEGCQIIGYDWRYLYVNDAAVRFGRQSRDELLGHTVMERYPNIENTEMLAALQHCMKERTAHDAEFEFTYPDGSTAWFEFRIQPVPDGIFILTLDITRRKHAEADIRASEQQLKLFVNRAPAAIAMLDRDMNYLVVSERWLTDYRLSEQQVVGRSHYELFPDLPEHWKQVHRRCLAGAVDRSDAEPFPRTDGLVDWVRWEILPWRMSTGEVGGILIFSEVVTKRKQAEEHIRKLHRTLGVLSDINQAIVRVREMPDLFQQACRIAVETGDFRMAWVGLIDPTTQQVTPVAQAGFTDGNLQDHKILLSGELHGRGAAARTLRTGARVVSNDIAHDSRARRWRADAMRLGYRASAAFPLTVAGEVRGTLNLYAGETEFFDNDELLLLDEMAGAIAFAMEIAEQGEQRRKAEEAVECYAQRTEILHQIDLGIINAHSLREIAETALKHIRQIIPCARANVGLIDPIEGEGLVLAVDKEGATALAPGVRLPILPLAFSGLDASHIQVFDDLRPLQETHAGAEQLVSEGFVSALTAVFMDQGRPIGVLGLLANTPGFFTPEHQEIAAEVASQLAIAIHQMNLSKELARHAALLEQRVAERTAEFQAAKKRAEAILNNSVDGILLLTPDLRIRQTNAAINQLFACNPDDYFNRVLIDLIQSDDADELLRTIQARAAEGSDRNLEVRAVRKDGSVFDVELNVGQIVNDGLVCVMRDITERKRAEEALNTRLEEEREFQSYLRALHEITIELAQVDDLDAFYRLTVERGLQRLGFERLSLFLHDADNDLAVGTYGTDPEGRLVAEPELRFVPAADGIMGRALSQPQRFFLDENVRLSGSYEETVGTGWNAAAILWNGTESLGWLVADNLLSHMPASKAVLDTMALYALSVGALLARRQTVAALRESEARYRLLAENVTDMILKTDPDGMLTFNSPSSYALIGYTPEELVGSPGIEFVHPEDRNTSEAVVVQALASSQSSYVTTQRLRHKAGHYVWVEAKTSIVRDPDTGNVLERITVVRDITERKRAEETLNARMEEEREFQTYLKGLHEITIELTQIDRLDDFYRRVVELGLERLGFDRLALFLYDAEQATAIGTFGTDVQGNISDERQLRYSPVPNGIMMRAYQRSERFAIDDPITLLTATVPTGTGWNAAAVLWNGTESLGWLTADNFLHQKPSSKPQLDILSLYALTIGSLLMRKQTVDALRESEARYRLLADNISDVVMQMNAASELLYVSPSSRTVLGHEPEELVGQLALNYVHPDDLADTIQAMTAMSERNLSNLSLVVRFRHKQGHYVWLENNGKAIFSDTGAVEGFVSSSRDVSVRKRAEEALQRSEERLRESEQMLQLVLDTVPVRIFWKDRNSVYQGCNRLFAQDSGFRSLTDIVGRRDIDNLGDRDLAAGFVSDDVAVMESGNPKLCYEETLTTASGLRLSIETSKLPLRDSQGAVIGVLGTYVDITERKLADEALRASEERFRLLVDSAPVSIVITNHAGDITLVNREAETLFGYKREELVGQSVEILIPDSARAAHVRHRAAYAEAPRMRPLAAAANIFGRRKNGDVFPADVQLSYVRTNTEFLVMTFVIDITTQKQAEQALLEALNKERELGELKSRFVSMASHEFRTPLASILAVTETLSAYRDRLSDDQIEQRLDRIKTQVGHLKDIMEDVLMLARVQARRVDFNPVKVDLDALIKSILDEFQDRPDIGNRLTYHYAGELHDVRVDRKLIRLVISNLVSNAIKYSPDDKPIMVVLEYAADQIVLTVRDEGIGIPEADKKHLFEPFHRAANVGTIHGTGLGLIITKESVDLHSGSISVDSQVGIGTTFTVRIPTVVEGKGDDDENPGN